jgi:hypothetical protein
VDDDLIIAEGAHNGARRRPRHESPREVPEVNTMPRTVQDILDHADELARRFEDYQPDPDDERDPQAFTALRDAVLRRSDAERTIQTAVDDARRHGYSWTHIGTLLGTTGEAARQRYAPKQQA